MYGTFWAIDYEEQTLAELVESCWRMMQSYRKGTYQLTCGDNNCWTGFTGGCNDSSVQQQNWAAKLWGVSVLGIHTCIDDHVWSILCCDTDQLRNQIDADAAQARAHVCFYIEQCSWGHTSPLIFLVKCMSQNQDVAWKLIMIQRWQVTACIRFSNHIVLHLVGGGHNHPLVVNLIEIHKAKNCLCWKILTALPCVRHGQKWFTEQVATVRCPRSQRWLPILN